MLDFKHINVELVGIDGNAYSIMARVQKAMRRGDCTQEEITEVLDVMKSGDYNHLLCTVMDVFSCDGEGEEDDYYGLCGGCGESFDYCDCEEDCS